MNISKIEILKKTKRALRNQWTCELVKRYEERLHVTLKWS